MNRRLTVFVALAAAAIVLVAALPPIRQGQSYHAFAGDRAVFGVPNFWNVVSNLGFALAGLLGLARLGGPRPARVAWIALFAGLIATAAGSAWYHLRPSDETLFWDRLPMTVVFCSLLAILIADRISPAAGRALAAPLVAAGAATVFYWRATGDLRPYVFTQFFPAVAIPAVMKLYPSRPAIARALWLAMACYAAAKLLEVFDARLYAATGIPGHPLKHLAAAGAGFCLVALSAATLPARR